MVCVCVLYEQQAASGWCQGGHHSIVVVPYIHLVYGRVTATYNMRKTHWLSRNGEKNSLSC